MINYDDRIDESEFINVYSEVFLKEESIEKINKVFINYFTDVLSNLQDIVIDNFNTYEEFEDLSKEDIRQIVISFKEKNDQEVIKKIKRK